MPRARRANAPENSRAAALAQARAQAQQQQPLNGWEDSPAPAKKSTSADDIVSLEESTCAPESNYAPGSAFHSTAPSIYSSHNTMAVSHGQPLTQSLLRLDEMPEDMGAAVESPAAHQTLVPEDNLSSGDAADSLVALEEDFVLEDDDVEDAVNLGAADAAVRVPTEKQDATDYPAGVYRLDSPLARVASPYTAVSPVRSDSIPVVTVMASEPVVAQKTEVEHLPTEATIPLGTPMSKSLAVHQPAPSATFVGHNNPAVPAATQKVLVTKEVEVELLQEQIKYVPKKITLPMPVTTDRIIHRPLRTPVEVTREVPGEVIEVPVRHRVERAVPKSVYRDSEVSVAIKQKYQPVIKNHPQDKEVEATVYEPEVHIVEVRVPVVHRNNLELAPEQRVAHRVLPQVSDAEFNTLLVKMNPQIPSGLDLPFRRSADGSIPMLPLEQLPCQLLDHVAAATPSTPAKPQSGPSAARTLMEPEIIPPFRRATGFPAPSGTHKSMPVAAAEAQQDSPVYPHLIDRYPLHAGDEVKFTVLPSGRLQIDPIKPGQEMLPTTHWSPLQELKESVAREMRSPSVTTATSRSTIHRLDSQAATAKTAPRRRLQLFCCQGGPRASVVSRPSIASVPPTAKASVVSAVEAIEVQPKAGLSTSGLFACCRQRRNMEEDIEGAESDAGSTSWSDESSHTTEVSNCRDAAASFPEYPPMEMVAVQAAPPAAQMTAH